MILAHGKKNANTKKNSFGFPPFSSSLISQNCAFPSSSLDIEPQTPNKGKNNIPNPISQTTASIIPIFKSEQVKLNLVILWLNQGYKESEVKRESYIILKTNFKEQQFWLLCK